MEVKSSMTYDKSFETALRMLPNWVGTPISEKAVIYNGDFQNDAGEVKVINFISMNNLLPEMDMENKVE